MTVLDLAAATRAVALDESPTRTGDGRTLLVRLVTWNAIARVTDDGRMFYQESFAPGSVRCAPDAPVYNEASRSSDPHKVGPVLVGRIIGYRSESDGAYAEVRIADSAAGRDLLAEYDERVKRHVSIEFDAPTLPAGRAVTGRVVHTDALVQGLLFTNRPQSPGADILGRRSQGEPTMSETPVAGPFKGSIEGNIDGAITVPDPVAPVDPNAPPVDPNAAAGRAAPAPAPAAMRSSPSVITLATAPLSPAAAGVTTRFRSFGEFVQACAMGSDRISVDERETVGRAFAEAALADATGLVQTQWVAELIDLVKAYTPITQAFSSAPLPDKGMTVNIPKITGRPTVAKQVGESGILSSTKVTVVPVPYAVDVYGGGQNTPIGVLQRTEPSYLDVMMSLYTIEMGQSLETAIAAAVIAAADDVNAAVEMGNTDVLIQDAFTAACVPFLNLLRRLPEFALINTVLWQKMANAKDTTGRPLYPGVSPFNPVGSISFASPDGNVRELPFRVAPAIGGATSKAVVGVREAFRSMVGPMQTLQADVPDTLVHGFAVFEFAAFGVVDAAGLVSIVDIV